MKIRRRTFATLIAVALGMPLKTAEASGHLLFVEDDSKEAQIFQEYLMHLCHYLGALKSTDGHEPDERFMRDFEERIDISEVRANDFRRSIMSFVGTMAIMQKKLSWDCNPMLKKAIESKAKYEKA